jgi:hypothetical protein
VEPEAWIRGKKMILHEGATEQAIKKFFATDVGFGFPRSYRHFLAASDGVGRMWRAVFTSWLPTLKPEVRQRQEHYYALIASRRACVDFREIRQKRTSPNGVGRGCLPTDDDRGVEPVGNVLLYDHCGVDAAGEMQLGLQEVTDLDVTQCYPTIASWLQACLAELLLNRAARWASRTSEWPRRQKRRPPVVSTTAMCCFEVGGESR